MRKFVLDAGHPYGLRCGPQLYLLREQIRGSTKPVMYDTYAEALKAAGQLAHEEKRYLFVKSYDDGQPVKFFWRNWASRR